MTTFEISLKTAKSQPFKEFIFSLFLSKLAIL